MPRCFGSRRSLLPQAFSPQLIFIPPIPASSPVMTSKQTPHSIDLRCLRLYAVAAAVAAIVAGVFVLLGWTLDLSAFKSILPGKAAMKPNTAICFALSGAALVLMTITTSRKPLINTARKRAALISSCLVAMIGIMTLAEYFFRFDLGIDALMFPKAL